MACRKSYAIDIFFLIASSLNWRRVSNCFPLLQIYSGVQRTHQIPLEYDLQELFESITTTAIVIHLQFVTSMIEWSNIQENFKSKKNIIGIGKFENNSAVRSPVHSILSDNYCIFPFIIINLTIEDKSRNVLLFTTMLTEFKQLNFKQFCRYLEICSSDDSWNENRKSTIDNCNQFNVMSSLELCLLCIQGNIKYLSMSTMSSFHISVVSKLCRCASYFIVQLNGMLITKSIYNLLGGLLVRWIPYYLNIKCQNDYEEEHYDECFTRFIRNCLFLVMRNIFNADNIILDTTIEVIDRQIAIKIIIWFLELAKYILELSTSTKLLAQDHSHSSANMPNNELVNLGIEILTGIELSKMYIKQLLVGTSNTVETINISSVPHNIDSLRDGILLELWRSLILDGGEDIAALCRYVISSSSYSLYIY
jgi:hypothetical protein